MVFGDGMEVTPRGPAREPDEGASLQKAGAKGGGTENGASAKGYSDGMPLPTRSSASL